MTPRIYLAGAIRDGRHDDINWRERLINLIGEGAIFLNPLACKTYDQDTRTWKMSGIKPTADVIVPHDFWMVERADIIVFNLTALAEGYPNIGTLVEFGHATGLHPRPLIYSIVEQGYQGHDSPTIFKLHPFLLENSAVVFNSIDDCEMFLSSHISALNGNDPHFHGASVEPDSVNA